MLAVANLYYDQVLLLSIAYGLQISSSQVGLLTTFIQVGYMMGLLFIVPLGDFFNRRKVILVGVLLLSVFMFSIVFITNYYLLLMNGFCLGVCTVSAQIIIPFVSSHTDSKYRSQHIGPLLTGVFLGVLFGRVVGGFLGQFLGRHIIHMMLAGIILINEMLLYFILPNDNTLKLSAYKSVMLSLFHVLKNERLLYEIIFLGMMGFCVFNIFWVSLPFILQVNPIISVVL